jgi:hypothetical protein
MAPNAAALTALGQALGCTEQPSRATRPLARVGAPPTPARGVNPRADRAASQVEKPRSRANSTDNLPESCYYAGPLAELGPAPPRHIQDGLDGGWMAREARELAERGRADLIRFFQMKARLKARGRKAPRRSQKTEVRRQNAEGAAA